MTHPPDGPLRPECGCYADDPACPHTPTHRPADWQAPDPVAARLANALADALRDAGGHVTEVSRGQLGERFVGGYLAGHAWSAVVSLTDGPPDPAVWEQTDNLADLGGRGDVWECSVCGDGYEAYSASHATQRHNDEDGSHEPVWLS